MKSFKDKTFIVTGGTSGMGFAVAQQLASGGGKVIITGRTKTALDVCSFTGEDVKNRPWLFGTLGASSLWPQERVSGEEFGLAKRPFSASPRAGIEAGLHSAGTKRNRANAEGWPGGGYARAA